MADVTYKDLGLKKILKEVERAGIAKLRIGVVGPKATEPAGRDGRITNAENAVIQFYGTDHIPPRRFLTEPFQTERVRVHTIARRAAARIADGEIAEAALDTAGRELAVMVRDAIVESPGITPVNAPATAAKKGFSHPLVESGALAESISHQLVREGGGILEGGSGTGDYESFEITGGKFE